MPLSVLTRITLLDAARHSIEQTLNGKRMPFAHENADPALRASRTSFVTLKRHGVLRGCIGSLEARRPLLDDVMHNAHAAAFRDPRFPPLTSPELDDLHIEISILSAPQALAAKSRNELLGQLRRGEDGLIVQEGTRRATFLPAVWKSLPNVELFYDELMKKAGLDTDHWSDALQFFRYTTESFSNEE